VKFDNASSSRDPTAHCITDAGYLLTGAGSCPCCWPEALCSALQHQPWVWRLLQARIHLLSWSSRSICLLACWHRCSGIIGLCLCLRLSDIGTTVALSCQALRTPRPCATGVCTSRRSRGAEPRTLFLAHERGSVFMQTFDSLTPILHLSPLIISRSTMSPRLPCQSGRDRFSGSRRSILEASPDHQIVEPQAFPLFRLADGPLPKLLLQVATTIFCPDRQRRHYCGWGRFTLGVQLGGRDLQGGT
jgi:hypothetical protein